MSPTSPPSDPGWLNYAIDHLAPLAFGIGGALMTAQTAAIAFIWRLSARAAHIEERQEQHEREIGELKARRATQDTKIETLATKEDLAEAQATILGELRTRMSDMTHLIASKG